MSQIKLVLPKGSYQLEELIKDIAQQNLDLIVMEELISINHDRYNEMHIIGSYGDLNLCDQIRSRLSADELGLLRYDEGLRQLIWVSNGYKYHSKVFYNVSSELASHLLST
jgi:hypothetical protein